jgi:hypothetical protein
MTKRTAGQVLYWTLLIALTAYGFYRNGWDAVQVWMVWLVVVGAGLWLRYRLETRLSRPVYTSLVEALQAQPANTPLVDYETGDRLAITGKRYLGMPDGWWVLRIPREPSGEDAMSDFNLGQAISTIPYTGFLVRAGRISTRVNAVPVTPPQEAGQPPVPLDPPRPSPWRRLRTLIFVVRTGARQVSQREVTDLIEQLRRAVPLDHHRDEDYEQGS